jgi:acyl-CoA synthetase (AMP-forming)/AMP-acid ligase II
VRGDQTWRSIPQLALDAAERFGPREGFVDGALRLSFTEMADAAVDSTRAALAGLRRGDRAAIWAPNSLEWMLAALGVMGAGATIVPVNTRFKGGEAAYVLERSGAVLLFTVQSFLGVDYVAMLRETGAELPVREIVVLDRGVDGASTQRTADTTPWHDYLARGAAISNADATTSMLAVDGEDISDIMFTSGTTGRPKGVLTTHSQNLRAFVDYTGSIGLREGDRYLIVNPFFHAFGFKAGWLACLLRGATAIPLPVFDLDVVMQTIERERISVLPGPPTLLHGILEHPTRRDHDLSSLRLTVTGAAAIPVELIRRLRDEKLFTDVLTGYGLTETSGLVSVSHRDDSAEVTASASGRVADGIAVKVVDDDGREVALGETGELLVRGYNVTQGYYGDPDETARTIDAHGWLRTGDIGTVDGDGNVRVTDRKKDMFIVGGFNAYPAEIENLLLGCDAIAEVALVGAPDERLGEVGVAFVVARPGHDTTPESVIAYARAHLANYKVPRHVQLVDALPVNASGKVLKIELRERARSLLAPRPT